MKLVILGLGTGGIFSAISARKHDRQISICVIDNKDFEVLHSCGLPYFLEGRLSSKSIIGNMPDIGAEIMLRHEVIAIEPEKKRVCALDKKDKKNSKRIYVNYDKLIISTGAKAFIPEIAGAEKLIGKCVFKIDSIDDISALDRSIDGKKKRIAVIGAGAIGIEVAYALKKRGMDVTVIESMEHSFPNALDLDMAEVAEKHLKASGIRLIFKARVKGFNSKKGSLDSIDFCCQAGDDPNPDFDVAIIATGTRPDLKMMQDAGIRCGKLGVLVNKRMQTNYPDIYAVGDIVQLRSLIDKRPWVTRLASAAYKQGIVAGANAAGGKRVYDGALTSFVTKIGDLEIASTGFGSEDAGTDIITGKAKALTMPEWAGKAEELYVKLIVEKKTHRIIGAQAVGFKGASHRIDVVSTAIKAGMTVYDLAGLEMCYCPAVSDVYDVLMQAADNAIRKIETAKNRKK
ncbi:FAD-dependent oxidoreductase [Candidatus Woesearchaeota archaeon]|nr:FAD-dependent oxidoreductase [Candidatus Woesearchaeota archaeon]